MKPGGVQRTPAKAWLLIDSLAGNSWLILSSYGLEESTWHSLRGHRFLKGIFIKTLQRCKPVWKSLGDTNSFGWSPRETHHTEIRKRTYGSEDYTIGKDGGFPWVRTVTPGKGWNKVWNNWSSQPTLLGNIHRLLGVMAEAFGTRQKLLTEKTKGSPASWRDRNFRWQSQVRKVSPFLKGLRNTDKGIDFPRNRGQRKHENEQGKDGTQAWSSHLWEPVSFSCRLLQFLGIFIFASPVSVQVSQGLAPSLDVTHEAKNLPQESAAWGLVNSTRKGPFQQRWRVFWGCLLR